MHISIHTEQYRKKTVLSHTQKSPTALQSKCNGYGSQARENRLCGAQTTAMVTCKLHSHSLQV